MVLLNTVRHHVNNRLAILAVTSHPFFGFSLFLRPSYKPDNDSRTVSYTAGVKAGLTNNQNMVFRYESTYLDLAYLNYQVNLNMHVFYYAMYNRQYLAQYLVEWRAQAI